MKLPLCQYVTLNRTFILRSLCKQCQVSTNAPMCRRDITCRLAGFQFVVAGGSWLFACFGVAMECAGKQMFQLGALGNDVRNAKCDLL